MGSTSGSCDRRARKGTRQTLAVFATGILAEATYVIGLATLCGVAIAAVLLVGG